MTTPALVLSSVSKSYGSTVAAQSVDLTVEPGELVTLIGPSGSGKSTALRLVAGLERPDEGTVTIAGDVVAGDGAFRPPERRRVGLVFQDHALFPHLSVAANVAFGLHRWARDERDKRVGEMLATVRISHLADRYPHELSGGEQQRVALARALAPRPAVVLLDEPFSSLDENLRAQVRAELIGILRQTGTTAIVVTHDQTEALSIGDRVVVMADGRIEQVAPPRTVFERPATRFVATFMGDASVLPAQIHDGRLVCEIGVLSTASGWGDVDVEVVLRPHEVTIAASPDPVQGAAEIAAVEYHGPFVLYLVRLASGHLVRSWQPHSVQLDVGVPVDVSVAVGLSPTLVVGDQVVADPPLQ